jgi:hypothetical protein
MSDEKITTSQDVIDGLHDRIEQLEKERDAAFALSKCECGTDEACANLVKLHDRIAQLEDQLAMHESLVDGHAYNLSKLLEVNKRNIELEQAQRWIPVGERLPSNDSYVLVSCSSGNVSTSYYSENVDFLSRSSTWKSKDATPSRFFRLHHEYGYQITHWLPLPKALEVE